MKTLFELVTDVDFYQQRKHDLGENYAAGEMNRLTNFEFLERLSEAMEVLLAQHKEETMRACGVHFTDRMD